MRSIPLLANLGKGYRRLSSRLMQAAALAVGSIATASAAQSEFGVSFSVASGVAGGNMISEAGASTNAVINVLMGPGMYVVMAIGVILALYGYFQKQKEWLITGAVGFVVAAVLRSLWGFL